MLNKLREARQNVIILVMNIVIVVMCVVMIICACTAVSALYEDFSAPYDERTMFYRIDYGDFHNMVELYHTNVQSGVEGNSTMKEYYGVAKYFQAASFYKAFLETGDTERADREKAKMEAALVEMGSWDIVENEINELLGVE